MVYEVRNTTALATISAVEKWVLSFEIPQSILLARGTASNKTDFVNRTKELAVVVLRPHTAHSPWTNGEIETQNQQIARYWRNLLNDAGKNWSSLAPNFAFAHNTSVNNTTGETPYEIVCGIKPQIPMSLRLGLHRNKHKLCCSKFCKYLPSHSHSENDLKNELLDNLLQPQLSQALLERERTFKKICSSTFERCRERTARSHALQSLQTGTPPSRWAVSTLQKEQTRPYTEPETLTTKAWTFYRHQVFNKYYLPNSR